MPESLAPASFAGHPDYPWSTKVVGADEPAMRHVSRDVAVAYAAARAEVLPAGTQVLIERWVVDGSTGLDLAGRPGEWQFDSAHVVVDGGLVELDEHGQLPGR